MAGSDRLRIAMIGTRGVPASYGGFETAVEEVGHRLVRQGHRVLVYGRGTGATAPSHHLGMRSVTLPALRRKSLETLSHTALSSVHAVLRAHPDVVFLFNAANAPFLPLLRAAGIPVATHVDGLEWQRSKWGTFGRRYYLTAERAAVSWSDALIADAPGIAAYYQQRYRAHTDQIAYGAPILRDIGTELLPDGLSPRGYHLVVARFEPENHVREIVRGYTASTAAEPLVVVGAAPYADDYIRTIRTAAQDDPRIRLLGRVDHQASLDQLYGHALTYLHGHSVGGTNPSLLRAMGAGSPVISYDVRFNRDTAGESGWYFASAASLARLIENAEQDRDDARARGRRLQERAATLFRWDDVAEQYAALAARLADRRGRLAGEAPRSAPVRLDLRDRPAAGTPGMAVGLGEP